MDGRLLTFLTLCETMNYREAADRMHLTQPAVTRQIQGLEAEYGIRLFSYDRHVLSKTRECLILEQYAHTLRYNEQKLMGELGQSAGRALRIGATKTIGDYLIYDRISHFLKNEDNSLFLIIENTEHLLRMLEHNELDFVLVEGIFQKEKYDWSLMQMEPFLGICPLNHPFQDKEVPFEALLSESIIVREPGSGTRDIFEREVKAAGYDFQAFRRCITVSSFPLICRLVREGYGISFAYGAVAEGLGHFQVKGWAREHAFHIIWLKNTDAGKDAEQFLTV